MRDEPDGICPECGRDWSNRDPHKPDCSACKLNRQLTDAEKANRARALKALAEQNALRMRGHMPQNDTAATTEAPNDGGAWRRTNPPKRGKRAKASWFR